MSKKKPNKAHLAALALGVFTPAIVAPIPVQFADAATHDGVFTDIPSAHVHFEVLRDLAKQGIISGYEDGTFKPNRPINRQHAAILINRAVESLPKTNAFVQPKDLPSDYVYFDEIKALIEADLLEVDQEGNIHPTKPLTRGEMAKILTVAFDLKEKASYDFKDTVADEYTPYVRAIYSNGITIGYEDATFKPDATLTRLHYSLFINKALNLDEDFVPEPIETDKGEPSVPKEEDREVIPEVEEKPIDEIELSPDMSLEDFNRTIDHNPLIDILYGDNEVYGWAWEDERHRKVLTEGQELLKGTNFTISKVSAYATFSKPNWENRYNQEFLEAPIIIDSGKDYSDIVFDYSEEDVTKLGLKYIEFLHPEWYAKYENEIFEKIAEGRNSLRTGDRSQTRMQIYNEGNTTIRFGVTDSDQYSYFCFEIY